MGGLKISVYLAALVLANFVVFWFGKTGLLFTAFLLIPFDFVMRSYFHEKWKGKDLFVNMIMLIGTSGLVTYLLNPEAKSIAVASASAFVCAQALAGIAYQLVIDRSYFVKVNGSDLIGIFVDSLVFQVIAFGALDWTLTLSQTAIKMLGGLMWYYIIFKLIQLPKRW